MDDYFYNYHKNIALKKKLKVISFGIKNKSSMIKLTDSKKTNNKYELKINVNKTIVYFYSHNNNKSNIFKNI